MFGVMNTLAITVCKDAEEATQRGFKYSAEYKAVEIEKVVVVKNGTMRGESTVDLVLVDEQGKRYVVMLTGNLVKSIPC